MEDQQRNISKITEVPFGWYCYDDFGKFFYMAKEHGKTPKVGQRATLKLNKGIAIAVALDGKQVYDWSERLGIKA